MPIGAGTGQAKQTKARSARAKAQDAIKLLKSDHDCQKLSITVRSPVSEGSAKIVSSLLSVSC